MVVLDFVAGICDYERNSDVTVTQKGGKMEDQDLQPGVPDELLAAAGLKKTTAYVKDTGKKPRSGSAERMARMREREAAAGVQTVKLDLDDQDALELGRAVQALKGWRRRLVLRWLRVDD